MVHIRPYVPEDASAVGRLIAATYAQYNLDFVPREALGDFLGPFRYADSPNEDHRKLVAQTIQAPIIFVAEDGQEIVGVLRGRKERLASLFVRGDYHRRGIGSQLVCSFEEASRQVGVKVIRVAATLFAVPFYATIGYKKSTGARVGWSFAGRGLVVQPMRKVFA